MPGLAALGTESMQASAVQHIWYRYLVRDMDNMHTVTLSFDSGHIGIIEHDFPTNEQKKSLFNPRI